MIRLEGHMASDTLEPTEAKETVAHSLPVSLVRAIEYRAYLDRSNKSEALARLIREGLARLGQRTPTDREAA
jgi:hypothetical protein